MQFILVTPFFIPHIGGVETFTYNLALALAQAKHEVTIITCKTDGSDFTKNIAPNVILYQLDSFLALNGRYPIPRSSAELLYLWRNVFHQHAKVVLNTRFFFTTPLFATISKLKRLDFIILEHGSNYIGFGTSLDLLIHGYEHAVTSYLRLLSAQFYGISTAACVWLKKFGINSQGKIHNCIKIGAAKNKLAKSKTPQKKTWLYIGRLLPTKGVIELCEAFSQFYSDSDAAELIIAGTGDLANEIARLSKLTKNIRFLGPVAPGKVSQLLAQGSSLFLPTRYPEGMPTIILEAFGHNCFVVTSNAGGLGEIVQHERTGYLLKNASVSSIKKAFKWLEQNQQTMSECTQNAHNYLLLEHSPSKVVYQVEQAFR